MALSAQCLGFASEHAGPGAGQRPSTVLRIAGGTFNVNGVELRLGDDVARWRSVLGKESRVFRGLSTVYVWDDKGVWVATTKRANAVIEVEITVNVEDLKESMVKGRAPQAPKRAYSGSLIFDGVRVSPTTAFRDIRAGADPQRNLRCGLRDCSHPHGGFGNDAELLVRLAGKSDQDKVLEMSFSKDAFAR